MIGRFAADGSIGVLQHSDHPVRPEQPLSAGCGLTAPCRQYRHAHPAVGGLDRDRVGGEGSPASVRAAGGSRLSAASPLRPG